MTGATVSTTNNAGGFIVMSLFAHSWAPGRRGVLTLSALALCAMWPAVIGAREQEIRVGGTGSALGTLKLLAQAYGASPAGARLNVLPSLGSSGAIRALLGGALQIAVSARQLTPAEVGAGAVAVECGRTPLVFATAADNPVNGITTQELIDVYLGNKTSWSDGSKLRLVLRPSGDSDSDALRALSPAMREALAIAEQRRGQLVASTDQDAASSIESIPGAVGTSTLALLLSENRDLKALALDGVVPTALAVAVGEYPLHRSLYLVTGPATTALALAFVAFVRSAAGAEILHKTGYWVL